MTAAARGVAVLGATGSIGRSTLEVVRRHPGRFRVVALTARTSARALDELAVEFEPDRVVLAGEPPAGFRPRWGGEWRYGAGEVSSAATARGADVVVNGLVGVAGLEPTLAALAAGRRLALANKESLVAGGDLVLAALREGSGELLPVDSEHSAVHQCLAGRPAEEVRRIVLTASGGPFRTLPADEFAGVGRDDALAHPTWSMGAKITVDSATLANKALEVIEAHHLFGLPYDRIDVVVHPSSIVHSMVEFRDGSVLAQMGEPTMEVPILYALAHPERPAEATPPFDPVAASPLTFERPRAEAFPMLSLGIEAGREGGVMPAAYNAANEVAVAAFLEERLGFPGIAAVVEATLASVDRRPLERLEDVWETDGTARELAREQVESLAVGGRA
ncbi:MAG TPA: 1-deoxy-D-xylulose-5-phosphate reductoisomerase [Gemmatimonadota bacterium]|nr:1-deoxy-D-xylulose-5-phosphate reductoisomerase [Gemmatimonadota bacterium]